MYADSLPHAQIDSILRTIVRQHQTMVGVDRFEFREMSRFVHEETLRWRVRRP